MSKHIRKILPLLLCLLLMACLLPAAYADGVEVSTLAELQAALNNSQNCVSTGQIGGPGSGIELTVPTGVTLDITSGFVCVSSMTVNGTVNVGDNGMLMVDQSLTGSGSINVAAGCQTFNLPAACYDSQTHGLVSLIHNNCSNVTLVHIPATYAELQSALLKAEDAANYGIDSGILIAQNLTISQNEVVDLNNMRLSVQYGATLTLDDHAVVVTNQDVMVEQSSIHVRGGAVLAASVQLNASTIDFSNGGGFFGKRFKVRNAEDPAACIRGLDLTLAERIDEESRTIFEFHINEPIYGGDPTVDSELALQNAISAFNQQREQDPSARIDAYTSGNFTITGNITIPDGFQLRCGNNLTIAADAVVTVYGKLDAIEGGHVSILGTVINNNAFRMFDTGVMELSGTLVNNRSVYYKRVSTDRTHLVINSGATFTNNSDFAIADDIVRDPAVLGVDVDGYCVARMWDEPDMSRYCAPEVFDHFEGMCSSGEFTYLELHGIEEVSVTEDMNIPEDMSVEMGSTSLIVPNGITLTVNGELTVKELVVEEGGSAIVNEGGYLDIGARSITVNGSLTLDNTWIDAGFPRTETFSFDNVSYIGNAGMILHLNNGNPNGIAKTIQMASATASEHIQCIVELRTDWTLEGFTDARNIGFVVLPGYTLTVNGTLLLNRFYDRGSVNVSEGGFLYAQSEFQIDPAVTAGMFQLDGTLSVEHTALVPEQLEVVTCGDNGLIDVSFDMHSAEDVLAELETETELFPHFRRSVWALFPWELEEDLTLPGQVRLCVPYGMGYEGSLLIPAGKSLTIPAGSELYARGAGPETQQAVVEVWGEIVNNGSIVLDWGDTLGDIALAGSGSISGSGSIIRDGQPYDLVEEHAAYAALTAACAVSYNEPTEYDIEGMHVFTIRDNLTIPANLSVFAIDSTFEVASSGDFTIAGGGELIAGSLESFGSTAVNGSLHLERDCRILENPIVLNGELVMTLDAWVNLMEFINAPDPDAVAARFSFGDDSLLDIWVEPTEESISDSLDYPMFHIPHIRETYCVTFPWTLDRDRVLQQDTRLLFHYGGDATGMLIIPEGKTFTIPEGSELFARGAGENGEAIVRIAGLLINDGVFTLQYTRAGWADAELIDGGVYTGRGTVTRGGEPYAIWNDPANADIRFPAGLKTVESQALANTGVYFSVYIPAGTESIAADAFGDKTELIVFGAPGSEAETFAGNKNYLFAPVAPAA